MVAVKLTITSIKNKDNENNTATRTSIENNDEIFEFHLQEKNVTPREPIDIKYPAIKFKEGPNKTELISKMATVHWDDHVDGFQDMDAKFADYLLDGILPGRVRTDTSKSKYDVGSYVYNSRENVVTQEYEIELTESPMFSILHLPSKVAVAGDGVYEAIRKTNDVRADHAAQVLVKADGVSQTVNSFSKCDDAGCQTATLPTSAAGVQAYGFEIADADGRARSPSSGRPEDFDRTVAYVERVLAQNALNAADRVDSAAAPPPRLVHLFTMTLPGAANRGLAVRCTQWNPHEAHQVAVGYGQPTCRHYTDTPGAVAVWSTKNPCTPERFYELDGLIITSLKFSLQHPNCLAIGFQCGEIILINITSKKLNVLYKVSKQFPLEINGILDLFWSIGSIDEFSTIKHYNCLVACSLNGRVARYHHVTVDSATEKIVMQLPHVEDVGLAKGGERQDNTAGRRDGGHPAAERAKRPAVFRATRLAELHQRTAYLVGTADGLVYSCLYEDPIAYRAKINAHFGPVRSLDKSPFSHDVFLTTGCDCTIKIWVGDIFQKPVITVHTGKQVERAVWSRTDPTVVASIIGDCIHVWDVNASTKKPISVHEATGLTDSNKCAGMEFTPDGRRLCVSDVGGNVAVYVWSDVAAAAAAASQHSAADQLMYCIAKSMYGQQPLAIILQDHRKEYVDVFARLHDEKEEIQLS